MSQSHAERDRRHDNEAEDNAVSPLTGVIGYELKRAQMATFQELIERLAKLELRPAQLSLLLILEKWPGINQAETANLLAINRANFVRMMDQFEIRGLARRETSSADRRGRRLYLTEQGQESAHYAGSILAAYEAELIDRLGGPGERDRFLDMLVRLGGDN